MGSYKDMINMIGNVKHVPMIIEDAILKSRQIMNTGGTFDPYNQNMGGPTFTDVTLDNPQERDDVSDPRDGLETRVGDSGVTEAGVGTSASRQSGIIDRKATKGGGSLSLTPYNIDTTIENPFVNPSVMMYDDGGNLQNVGMPQANMPLNMEELFLRQLFQESRFNSDAVSPAGATSMAQVMPDAFIDGLKMGY